MRRLGSAAVTAVLGIIAVVVAPGGAAVAAPGGAAAAVAPEVPKAPSPSPSTPAALGGPGAGQPICTISDRNLVELSGLVAIDNGYWAINDSNLEASAKRIFRLDNQCKLVSSIPYPTEAVDPEDVAVAPDGSVWAGDIGDNDVRRSSIALWKLAPGAKTPVQYRLTYPDGARDAEALLIGGDGIPVIVSKELGKPAGLYVPSATLVPNSRNAVALKRAGEFKLPPSETVGGPVGPAGRLVVTGGATAPDGKRVALRTYADAFEWDVTDGDLVRAITTGKPRATPLPNEPQGEAITYSRDGKSFITVSDLGPGKPAPLLRYTPAAAAPPVARSGAAGAAGAGAKSGSGLSTLDQITYLVVGVGLLGLLLVIIGIFAIRRARRQAAADDAGDRAGGGNGPGGPRGSGPGGPGGPRGSGSGGGGPGGARRGEARATGTAPMQPGIFDDDAEDRLFGPPSRGRRDERDGVYGGGAPRRDRVGRGDMVDDGDYGEYGLVDAAPPSRRGTPPPEPPRSTGTYGTPGGRGGGAVYGVRRDAPPDPHDRPDDPDSFDDRRRGYRR